MNRFFKPVVAAVLCAALVACNTNTTAALVQELGTAVATLAQLQNNPTLAAKITTDVAVAVKDIQNWKPGSTSQDIVQALQLVQDDLSLFPQTAQYAPYITLAIGTIQAILVIVSPGTVTTHVAIAGPHAKDANDFKKQWNAIAKAKGDTQLVIK